MLTLGGEPKLGGVAWRRRHVAGETPTLVRKLPSPILRVIGGLSDAERVLGRLQLGAAGRGDGR